MKIYKISQNINTGYDTYDSAVVVAENEDEAKRIPPYFSYGFKNIYYDEEKKQFWNKSFEDNVIYLFEDEFGTWTNDLSKIKVEYLGEAKKELERGIIVASFNAG